jgi:hypothetical protein
MQETLEVRGAKPAKLGQPRLHWSFVMAVVTEVTGRLTPVGKRRTAGSAEPLVDQ